MEPKGNRCVIISGGQYSSIVALDGTEYVIACDKGYEYAVHEGITPNLIIGDFDSCSEATRQCLAEDAQAVAVERYPSEKDDTDTMLAIKRALELGYQRIVICCALGGRLDHLYANVQSLVYGAKHGAVCSMEDAKNCIYAFSTGKLELTRRDGWSVSLFAATDVCKGITTMGLKYSLEDGELVNTFPLGMSNEWETDLATVEVKEGILLVMMSKKDGE